MKISDSGDRWEASIILSSGKINEYCSDQTKFDSLGAEKSAMFYNTVIDANSLDKENGNHNKVEQRMQMRVRVLSSKRCK